eukprot:gene615-1188_t
MPTLSITKDNLRDAPPVTGYSGHIPSSRHLSPEKSLSLSKSMRKFDGSYISLFDCSVIKHNAYFLDFKQFPPMDGYTGHIPPGRLNSDSPPSSPDIIKIRGYSGFIKGSKNIYGQPIIPDEEVQLERIASKTLLTDKSVARSSIPRKKGQFDEDDENYLDLDLQEKYLAAMEHLWVRGQTPQMLLRILQGKVSERFSKYSDELIKVRKHFEAFDVTGVGSMDVPAFRQCIELLGCHFDEVQSLALFSYFDDNHDGRVSWEELADHVIMHNPAGGKLVPKVITATKFNQDWKSLGKAMYI